MEGISGCVAVVTGAGQGNGLAIASGLARKGARVVLCDVNETAVQAAAYRIKNQGDVASAFKVDVANKMDSDTFAAKVGAEFGPVEILVNNAGIIRRTPIDADRFEEDWEAIFRVNVDGVRNMVRAFLPQLTETKGRIVNLGSIMSVSAGPALGAYAASKGAVLQFTRALAHDLAPRGIRVNAIAPGVIATPMTQVTRDDPAAIARFMTHTPLGRVGEPDELVGPVLFLASNLSSYVTGALVPVDGGYLAA